MPPTKYGRFVTRDIIGESKYPQITTPIARYQGCRSGGNALTCEWSCITKPLVMDDEPEVDNERDQFLLFGSTNIDDSNDFQATIELAIGEKGKKQIITEPTYVYLPRGTKHGFVNFKKIKKPIAFLSYFLSPEFSTSWVATDETKYLAKIGKQGSVNPSAPPPLQTYHPSGTPGRYLRFTIGRGLDYGLWPSIFGWPAKVSPAYYSTQYREYAYLEPVHAHRSSHQVSMYLGGNPLDIEEFDARVELFMGKEREEHVIDTCAVVHYVPGLVHLGDEVRRVGKPFIHILWVIGPEMNDYYKGAAKDKVLLSDESKGEVMIAEGAVDYVPPTKIEDWVWPYPTKKH